jgi:hypothetical protein
MQVGAVGANPSTTPELQKLNLRDRGSVTVFPSIHQEGPFAGGEIDRN